MNRIYDEAGKERLEIDYFEIRVTENDWETNWLSADWAADRLSNESSACSVEKVTEFAEISQYESVSVTDNDGMNSIYHSKFIAFYFYIRDSKKIHHRMDESSETKRVDNV